MPLSGRLVVILDFISAYVERYGCSPSQREIAKGTGYKSPGGLRPRLDELERGGYIEWQPNLPRTIRLSATTPPAPEVSDTVLPTRDGSGTGPPASDTEEGVIVPVEGVLVPMLGRISAGMPILTPQDPILAQKDIEYAFSLPQIVVGYGVLFLVRVRGDSMVNAAILDGDWVVVRQQPNADDGQTVAALIEGEATVKVLRRHAGHVWLMPQQADPEPIPGDDATVLGVVVAVLRSLRPTRSP
jgi:repressor LexA